MPDSRGSALRVWVPAVVSLLVQVATTGAVLRGHTQLGPIGGFGRPCCDVAVAPGAASPSTQADLGPAVAVLLGLLALVGPVLLVGMRRHPAPVLTIITAAALSGTVLCAVRGTGSPFYISVLFAGGAAVFQRRRAWAWACVAAYWLGFALSYLFSGSVFELGWLVPLTLLSVGSLLGPEFGRGRREARMRAIHDAEARRASEAQAERVRIARELHDVLAHSLSQINVQASVGLHLFDSRPDQAEAALASIKDTSKQALGDVRQVLGMLRGDAPLAPEPTLAGLEDLVAGLLLQGIETTLRVEVVDASRLPAAVQLAVYRIVQEALTNVSRHAQAAHVAVAVTESTGRMIVSIVDDGRGVQSPPASAGFAGAGAVAPDPATTTASSGGRGLLGMRERAELLGGTFSAGPRAAGGFEVAADLPLRGAS
ncbi:sensor histidine kinase [Gryllotalpicola reticulitermitis]|uniref:histidine kinase n=1 Tax=Gryllotalpicola reticulitermitis TaxID=1184153 RepID=A0ABV8Q3K9_9MICO